MGEVVTFIDYRPPARLDGLPYTEVQIEEASTGQGPFTLIESVPLTPLDTDPANPSYRSFTTENGTGIAFWYRVRFADATGDTSQATIPVQNVAQATAALEELMGTALCSDEDVRLYLNIKPTDLSEDDRNVIIRLVNAASNTFADESQRLWIVPEATNPYERLYTVAYSDIARGWMRIDDAREIVGVGYSDPGVPPTSPTLYEGWYSLSAFYEDEPVMTKVFLQSGVPFLVGSRVLVEAEWGWANNYLGVPPKVRQAVCYTAAEWYARDVQKFSGTFSLEEGRVMLPQVLPSQVRSIAESYRRWRVA